MRLKLLLAAFLACSQGGKPPALSVSANSTSGLGGPGWWFVDIKADGTIDVMPLATVQPVKLRPAEMATLRRSVLDGRLFELRDSYGTRCSECPACTLKINLAGRRKTITVSDISGASDRDKAEAKRVLKVLRKVKEMAGIADREDGC